MLKHKNLIIIGTSHIAQTSLKEIEHVFHNEKPEIIAVELDHQRLSALLSNQKPSYSPSLIPHLGLKGYLFALIGGLIQQRLGTIAGIKPGSDMLRAVQLAQLNKKKVALIDRDVRITLARLSKAIKWREKLNFIIDFFSAPFSKKIRINLKDVPERELIKKLLAVLKERYPGIYQVLVEERNRFMAIRLRALTENYPDQKILAVIGAGHEEELLGLVKKTVL
ncbi:TraB/GumN family protein [Candidatus Woesearchaeota archaeon]|nr:TraB/GumN family protein [Candidatus Woesearchaeota archaeon]